MSKCHFVIRFVDHNSHYMGELIGLILLVQAFCSKKKKGVNLKLIATKGISNYGKHHIKMLTAGEHPKNHNLKLIIKSYKYIYS